MTPHGKAIALSSRLRREGLFTSVNKGHWVTYVNVYTDKAKFDIIGSVRIHNRDTYLKGKAIAAGTVIVDADSDPGLNELVKTL